MLVPCLLELCSAEESAAAAATAFRRLPPFRESVVPWLAAAARVALGATAEGGEAIHHEVSLYIMHEENFGQNAQYILVYNLAITSGLESIKFCPNSDLQVFQNNKWKFLL